MKLGQSGFVIFPCSRVIALNGADFGFCGESGGEVKVIFIGRCCHEKCQRTVGKFLGFIGLSAVKERCGEVRTGGSGFNIGVIFLGYRKRFFQGIAGAFKITRFLKKQAEIVVISRNAHIIWRKIFAVYPKAFVKAFGGTLVVTDRTERICGIEKCRRMGNSPRDAEAFAELQKRVGIGGALLKFAAVTVKSDKLAHQRKYGGTVVFSHRSPDIIGQKSLYFVGHMV